MEDFLKHIRNQSLVTWCKVPLNGSHYPMVYSFAWSVMFLLGFRFLLRERCVNNIILPSLFSYLFLFSSGNFSRFLRNRFKSVNKQWFCHFQKKYHILKYILTLSKTFLLSLLFYIFHNDVWYISASILAQIIREELFKHQSKFKKIYTYIHTVCLLLPRTLQTLISMLDGHWHAEITVLYLNHPIPLCTPRIYCLFVVNYVLKRCLKIRLGFKS